MKLRKICKNKLAFTLVELVVVIAIMAILAGAVAGVVVGVRESANYTAIETAYEALNEQVGLLFGDTITEAKITDKNALYSALDGQLKNVVLEKTKATPEGNDVHVCCLDKNVVWIYTSNKMLKCTINLKNGSISFDTDAPVRKNIKDYKAADIK